MTCCRSRGLASGRADVNELSMSRRRFNVTTGYIEGVVRGYRNTLLTGQQYSNLAQCETIDGTASSVLPCSTMASD
jgi:hypothetical protein